jgi:Ser/Thr protein kinase RdoA (MazF antagonist)
MSEPRAEFTIATGFEVDGRIVDVQPLGKGLINDTWLVTTDAPAELHFVLQRINRRAFPQPERIMQNLRALNEHQRQHNAMLRSNGPALWLPDIVPARDGGDFVIDERGDFWRALDHIEDAVSVETISSPRQAEQVGAGLGRFHALVADLDPARMHVTRPGFHQTPQYYAGFAEAAARAPTSEGAALDACMAFARARAAAVSILEDAKQNRTLRTRVIHGDPKLDNFMFSADTGRVRSLIDLDTVQPGLVHYDIGDCLRSVCNPVGESPPRLDDVRFDLDICRALLEHYFAEARAFLSAQDIAHFYDAARLIPFELGLRFLTDHLNGDVYFKTERRGHNLHRAQVQFRLTADIERNEPSIRSIISALA